MHARIQFSDQAMGDKIYIKVFAPVIMEHISALYKKLFTYKPVFDADDSAAKTKLLTPSLNYETI